MSLMQMTATVHITAIVSGRSEFADKETGELVRLCEIAWLGGSVRVRPPEGHPLHQVKEGEPFQLTWRASSEGRDLRLVGLPDLVGAKR